MPDHVVPTGPLAKGEELRQPSGAATRQSEDDEAHATVNPLMKQLIEVAALASACNVSPAFSTMLTSSGARSVAPAAIDRAEMICVAVAGAPPLGTRWTVIVRAPPVGLSNTARLTTVCVLAGVV